MSDAKVVFGNPEIYGINVRVVKTCLFRYTARRQRWYRAPQFITKQSVCKASRLGTVGILLILTFFRCNAASAQEEQRQSILSRIEKADLVTISALRTNAGDVQNLPAQLFSLASLIDSKGIILSEKKEDNSLINKVERFSLVGKGKISGENALGAKGFEVVVTGDGTTGKLLIYSDSLLTKHASYMRWRHVANETEYLRRTFRDGTVREEILVLKRDGSGRYQAGARGKQKEKLEWDSEGKVLAADEKR